MNSMLSADGPGRRRWTGPTDSEASIQPKVKKVNEVRIGETRYKQTGPQQAGIAAGDRKAMPGNRVIKRESSIASIRSGGGENSPRPPRL